MTAPPAPSDRGAAPARVVLVHGAWHRGSSWGPVVTELERRGVPAVAPDLPVDRPGAGYDALLGPVLDAAGGAGPVVLVGHSLGGLVAPVAAERLGPDRVRALAMVGALVPEPGRAYIERLRAEPGPMVPGYDAGVRRGEGRVTYWPDGATAASGVYRGVAEELAALGHDDPDGAVAGAVAGLRPQDWSVLKEPSPLTTRPSGRTVSVVCTADAVVDPGVGRQAAAGIGARLVELAGGHFPMLTRPAELAEVLAGLAAGH
ncbi:alpha/beta fold hydrolase [Pseudonocardia nantongensis]|uniref:alpha/beta fold hydrolase n=1 Tax=Pseudonocardia nantongensis TaxID=1181885 RepID=UPI0039783ACF